MSRVARCGLLLGVAGLLYPAGALAQSAAPYLPSYAHPSYSSSQFVVRGRIVSLGNIPDVEVSDGEGHISDIAIAPGMTVIPYRLQLGTTVVIHGVRNGSGDMATTIEIDDAAPEDAPPAPPTVDIAPPAPLTPIAPPAFAPDMPPVPAAAAPPPPSARPPKTPRLAARARARTPHRAVVIAEHRLRQYRRVQHADVAPNAPAPVRRVSQPLVNPSPQGIAPTWYGWGKL